MLLSSFTWILIVFTIIAQTANRILTKYVLFKVKPLPLTIFTNAISVILLTPFVFGKFGSLVKLDTKYLFLLATAGIAWGVFGYVYNVALEKSPVSTFTIITQLQVILVAFLGFLFSNQKISTNLAIGIIFICLASILASYKKEKNRDISNIALLLCLATAFSGAMAIFLDSYNARFFDTILYVWIVMFISNIPLYFFYKPTLSDFKLKTLSFYIPVGIIFTLSYSLSIKLVSQPDVQIAYVYPILRLGTIFAVIIGIFYFREKTNWQQKIIAIILAFFGAIFIKLA